MKPVQVFCLIFLIDTMASFAKPEQSWQIYIEVEKPLFKEAKRDRRRVIDYMAKFHNLSARKIVEIKYTTEFIDRNGAVIFKNNGSSKQDLKPGRSSRDKDFYSYRDNEFLSNDTYDILLPLVKSKSKKFQNVSVRSIKFENGDIIKF